MAEGDTVSFTCEFTYAGDDGWKPIMTWMDDNGVIMDPIDESSGKVVKVSVQREVTPEMDGFVFAAQTHFADEYDGSLPADFATNKPSFTTTHTYDKLVVHCECLYYSGHLAF